MPFCPYHSLQCQLVHTILSNAILSIPFCPMPFCPYHFLQCHFVHTIFSFCPYHFVRYHFVLELARTCNRYMQVECSCTNRLLCSNINIRNKNYWLVL